MNLYFISGLGADKRVFQNLILPYTFKIHHIEWLTPADNETLELYCRRLSEQIDPDSPYSLVGLSFGGIIAIEMSKFLSPVQTVVISGFCFKKEVPRFYIFIANTGIYRIIPTRLFMKPNGFVFWLFGAYRPGAKNLLIKILQETDPGFFKWAIRQLFTWDNHWKPKNLVRIHGTADKILPFKFNMEAIPVEGGEHLMVYSKSEIVSELLDKNLLTA
jgi:hypothetical protein